MKQQQLPFFRYNLHSGLNRTAKVTNSVNSIGIRTFNKWGGISYEDILSNYPNEIINKCWDCLGRLVVEHYLSGRGTFIKGFGTFTFTNIEYDLEGTTNQFKRDLKKRHPVFIVSNEFIDYIKSGIYTEKSGLIQYTQQKNNSIPIIKANFAKLSFGVNISKEECYNIIMSIIKNMADQIRRGLFKTKPLKEIGVFVLKEKIFGVKFDEEIINNSSLQTQKFIHTRNNLRFYMETKDCEKVPHYNISDIDLAEREIRPNLSVVTKITSSGEKWLKDKMNINIPNDIKDYPRADLFFKNAENKKEYYVDQRPYRLFPLQNLYGLKIPQNILESIYKNKNLIIRAMKQKDRHGDGLLPKFDFLSTFLNVNCHHSLRIELIEKITNVYLNNDPNIIMIHYVNLINALCKDIKFIIDQEYGLFPIEKYKNKLYPDNKRSISQNCFSRDTGNLEPTAISSMGIYEKFPNIEQNDIKEEIEKINNIIYKLYNYCNKIISYLELISFLERNSINISKIKMIQLLKYLEIENPNAFSFNDFVKKITEKAENNGKNKNKKVIGLSYPTNLNMNKTNLRYHHNKNNTITSGFFTNQNNRNILSNEIKDLSDTRNLLKKTFTPKRNDYLSRSVNMSGINIKKLNDSSKKMEQINSNISNNTNSIVNNSTDNNNNNTNNINYTNNSIKNNIINSENINLKNSEIIVKCIKIIKDRIFQEGKRIDLISEYFDHLLSYNLFRSNNVIYPNEFTEVLKLEKYDFNNEQLSLLFSFIDTRKDGYIDRNEFINSIRNVPHPISTIHNYILNNKLSIYDIAYKMDIDLYNRPINDILNTKYELLTFQGKMKLINKKFSREFIAALFNAIGNGSLSLSIKKILDTFNVNKDESYKEIYEKKSEIFNICIKTISNNTTYYELRKKFLSVDTKITCKVPMNTFFNVMHEFLKEKLSDENILHLLRMYQYIDEDNNVEYRKFILLIYLNGDDNSIWFNCLNEFMKYLKEECVNDVFIFVTKFNNMCNNTEMKTSINENKFYEFLRCRVNMVDMSMVKRFDYDKDGEISMDDLKNIIMKYVDKNFFQDQKKIQENIKKNNELSIYNENKKLYKYIKESLIKINMTINNFFYYLDKNKDKYIDINEFINQLLLLPLEKKYSQRQLETFFNFLDEFHNNKVDINTFRLKLEIFDKDIKLHNEDSNKGNSTIERLIFTEFVKYCKKNYQLSDTELFSLLDKDSDGQISKEDLKNFAMNILLIIGDELNDIKLLHCIECISLTKSENLILSDLQKLMQCIRNNNIDHYINNIYNLCNESVASDDKKILWINEIIYKIGMFINENYLDNIEKFYDEFNKNDFRNGGQGLSIDNFVDFMETNYRIFECYHITKIEQQILFNYISNNAKYISLENLKNMFANNSKEKKYDFYGNMHNSIGVFIHDNFPKCEDAFKYFHEVKTVENETPTSNDVNSENTFLTKKEFFNGINKLFPNIYKTNTILNYYHLILKKGIKKENYDIINYSEFNYIYYNEFNYDNKFKLSLNVDSKIKTTRPNLHGIPFMTPKSPFITKDHILLETPYDLDPLRKIKRLITSSKIDFNKDFLNLIKEGKNYKVNKYEFRNMIKKLDLGLTNIEIEDIINKSGLTPEGYINVLDFYKYITEENQNLTVYKKNVKEPLKEIKQLMYKYYTNPRLVFELNDAGNRHIMDFDTFKKIVIDLYKREGKNSPPYSVMKYIYDYIDIRKDGIIDINEWSKKFAEFEGKLDGGEKKNNINNTKTINLRKWETSNNIFDVYRLISRNSRTIKAKVKAETISSDCMIIQADNLINIIKDVLPSVILSATQWKMIVSLGEITKNNLIDFNTFINVVNLTSKIEKSHIKI